uniref:Insulin-like growth factor binding protein 5a n=1 Tax=Sinonovacula constricta TaxID=98310 RepID=A0A0U2J9P7_SINCO|nr:insulin-like growth factor binding protein 5a [Sinonovacula constricta]
MATDMRFNLRIVTVIALLGTCFGLKIPGFLEDDGYLKVRRAFNCEGCHNIKCPLLPYDCEPVKEIGVCSCCLTCARQLGEYCGVTKGRCGKGLQCKPLAGGDELLSLYVGRAMCVPYW